ncbi:hypothetical protein HDV02_004307 [Globomyces sp. JEL0801]|nr:hypothetical protein HDV02_004307 [Globomyces sp. JEL0801]
MNTIRQCISKQSKILQPRRYYAAKSDQPAEETLSPFQPFVPRKPLAKLPNVKGIPPRQLHLPNHPRAKMEPQTLLRSIDFESQLRFDVDGRSKMFLDKNPTVLPGAILLVEQISSRSSPQKRSFAGVYLGLRKKGVLSNIVLRTLVMGTGVEMVIPIFSPMVLKFIVLKDSNVSLEDQKMKDINWIREHPEKSGVDFNEIENIVIRYKNQQLRLLNDQKKLQ